MHFDLKILNGISPVGIISGWCTGGWERNRLVVRDLDGADMVLVDLAASGFQVTVRDRADARVGRLLAREMMSIPGIWDRHPAGPPSPEVIELGRQALDDGGFPLTPKGRILDAFAWLRDTFAEEESIFAPQVAAWVGAIARMAPADIQARAGELRALWEAWGAPAPLFPEVA